jgi:ornithine--oxo-acid transaminase
VRGRGLWVGAEIDPAFGSARTLCERLVVKGVLSKETHDTVVRLAPPLVISREDLDWALDRVAETLREIERQARERSPVAPTRAGSPQAA